jgi:hypothetical protein
MKLSPAARAAGIGVLGNRENHGDRPCHDVPLGDIAYFGLPLRHGTCDNNRLRRSP